MPAFRCLGHLYEVSQQDLERAPASVLAEAWAALEDGTEASLHAWPEPSADALKVRLSRSWPDCRQ